MIITRTPLRISLGGGGTDLPWYYNQAGHGFLIAAAITKYVFIAVNSNFDDEILLKYSASERTRNIDDVAHPLLRECLRSTDVGRGIEVSSMADIPAGTGLGSSGSFTVGALKALHMYKRSLRSRHELADEACRIEIDVLKEGVGKQDQYIAAFGGLTAFTFNADGSVAVEPLQLPDESRDALAENLLLFYTGIRRSAGATLTNEQTQAESPKAQLLNLDQTREIGYQTRTALHSGHIDSLGELLTQQWKLKYSRQPSALHDQIDEMIREGMARGASGGKLVGAGGGGFLLFYSEDKMGLRKLMKERGLAEVRFGIDYEGSSFVTTT